MLGVFGGDPGYKGGAGARLSPVFDPWTETWAVNKDMAVGDRDAPRHLPARLGNGIRGKQQPRAFGGTQDTTLLLPSAGLKHHRTETRSASSTWRLGPIQRLPRGYHSNAPCPRPRHGHRR